MRNWIKPRHLVLAGLFLCWFAYCTYFWSHAFFTNPNGGLSTTNVNIWGDWAAHFTMGSHMGYNELFPRSSPLIVHQSFSYPFAADWLAGLLIRLGVPFVMSFVLPSYVCSVLTVVLLYALYEQLFHSWKTAVVASALFLFNGGLGFIYFIQDILQSKSLLLMVLNPPREYTNIETLHYRWISVIQSMIIPQRAFTLGFPLALLVIIALITVYQKKKISLAAAGVAGVILGLLPILHTHSFLAVVVIATVLFLTSAWIHRKKPSLLVPWFIIAGIGITIASILIKLFFWSHVGNGFISWYPGWYSHQFPELNWFVFWIENWGVIPIIALWEFVVLILTKRHQRLHVVGLWAPFFLLFIALNLFLFQPFIWDNTKLLVWVSVGFSGLAAVWLTSNWQKTATAIHMPLKKYALRTILILIFLISIFAGAIDAYRIIRFDLHTYEMYSAEEVQLAEWAKQNTSPSSIWLTGDQHNHWLYNLTGRQPLLTYRGWLWTHGYLYHTVERDTQLLFEHPKSHPELFSEYGINYIVIGANEKETWKANVAEFRQLFPIIKQTPHYIIFARQSPAAAR